MKARPGVPGTSGNYVVGEIIGGVHDDDIREIAEAARYRMDQIARLAVVRLSPGARIRIAATDQILGGREGQVKKVNPKTIAVSLDPVPYDHRNEWKVPHSWVEAI